MKVVTFGEIMLRLAPEGNTRFVQAENFGATYAGGEANVAVGLSCFGVPATYVTKLPENEIGQSAVNTMRRFGVDTSEIVRGGKRIGIYFLEKGAAQRPGKVIYDRAGSAIAEAAASDFDWEKILRGADWFHFSGITPALGGELPEICLDACRTAQKLGVTVSCDVNYRSKLWTLAEARAKMTELCQYTDVMIANEGQACDVFGLDAGGDPDEVGSRCRRVSELLLEKFGLKKVAVTLRRTLSADDNIFGAAFNDGKDFVRSESYKIHIADRVGSGDAFSAGLIYACLNGFDAQKTVDFAVASGVIKHSINGDLNLAGVDEVMTLADASNRGRVER